jgi:RNA polymerase sigma-70 factor (ECF subfamily)
MADSSTTQLQLWIDRMNGGDAAARKELIGHACERLRRLTHKMQGDFPGVRRQEDTDDILNNAVLRLLRALDVVAVASVAEFFRLAALQIRRELLDLARHYARRQRAKVPEPAGGGDDSSATTPSPDKEGSDSTFDPQDLTRWTEFHQQVEALPANEREVFSLRWYHGLTDEEAASVLNVSKSTVKRWWVAARQRLGAELRGGEHD